MDIEGTQSTVRNGNDCRKKKKNREKCKSVLRPQTIVRSEKERKKEKRVCTRGYDTRDDENAVQEEVELLSPILQTPLQHIGTYLKQDDM